MLLAIILMMVLWNWGLTPLWVNVTITCLLTLKYLVRIGLACLKGIDAVDINKEIEGDDKND